MIKTNRLILKSLCEDDKRVMMNLFKSLEIKKTYMIPDYEDENGYEKLFDKFLNLSHMNNHFVRGIYLKDELIGFINEVEIVNKIIELGYVIDPKYKNNGYASESLINSINYLFSLGFEEIKAGAFKDNDASIKVMKKCGMMKIDSTELIEYRGILHECKYFSKRRI